MNMLLLAKYIYNYFVDVKYLDILFACMLLLYEMLHMILDDLKLSFVC